MDKQTSIWLPEDLLRWMRHEAVDRNISQSQLVRQLLEAERQRQAQTRLSRNHVAEDVPVNE